MKRFCFFGCLFFMVSVFCLVLLTVHDTHDMPDSLSDLLTEVRKPQLTDRKGIPLTLTYVNEWNSSSYLPLHGIPDFMKKAFILSEDKRFYSHKGVDWVARCHALVQNVAALGAVRGASTISEQVVRMIHKRPRTIWSRWIEGFDAMDLESKHTKEDILEFYLNQVPYAANRKGIVQASAYYFNRSPDTLNRLETLALVALVRAPSHFDLYRNPSAIKAGINRLAISLNQQNLMSDDQVSEVKIGDFDLERPGISVRANHFARHVYTRLGTEGLGHPMKIRTSLDGSLQIRVEDLAREVLESLGDKKVKNAACLVANHETGDILAWVSLATGQSERFGGAIDGVLCPRQPGSSMKPFLYALALDKGWTADQEILDSPLTNPVGRGLHTYHNYSRRYYGWVSLRDALGNSLNIPAIKTIRYVGYEDYLAQLHKLGFDNLNKHPDFYGDGLALGCGEVSLFHMVQAYGTLANKGVFRPLNLFAHVHGTSYRQRIFSEEAASLIGNILSDPEARNHEFGQGGLLNFPVQAAVKTGTSSDYRDAWAMGYNHRFVVGVWMGNFDSRPMDGMTGSTGPAIILRSVFAELNKGCETRPLFLSPMLVQADIQGPREHPERNGNKRKEWFIQGTEPHGEIPVAGQTPFRFITPVDGLEMAMDPRIPDSDEAFEFKLDGVEDHDQITWILDGKDLDQTMGGRYLWTLQKGKHVVEAWVYKKNTKDPLYDKAYFVVK
ncbi:MAG: transglycosylase domain-containing protein [Proteobacteria bacterium]|nr:transglycosylase domain-containing protein [Pseudomonadota bacterium]